MLNLKVLEIVQNSRAVIAAVRVADQSLEALALFHNGEWIVRGHSYQENGQFYIVPAQLIVIGDVFFVTDQYGNMHRSVDGIIWDMISESPMNSPFGGIIAKITSTDGVYIHDNTTSMAIHLIPYNATVPFTYTHEPTDVVESSKRKSYTHMALSFGVTAHANGMTFTLSGRGELYSSYCGDTLTKCVIVDNTVKRFVYNKLTVLSFDSGFIAHVNDLSGYSYFLFSHNGHNWNLMDNNGMSMVCDIFKVDDNETFYGLDYEGNILATTMTNNRKIKFTEATDTNGKTVKIESVFESRDDTLLYHDGHIIIVDYHGRFQVERLTL